jgi:hypothetical protein
VIWPAPLTNSQACPRAGARTALSGFLPLSHYDIICPWVGEHCEFSIPFLLTLFLFLFSLSSLPLTLHVLFPFVRVGSSPFLSLGGAVTSDFFFPLPAHFSAKPGSRGPTRPLLSHSNISLLKLPLQEATLKILYSLPHILVCLVQFPKLLARAGDCLPVASLYLLGRASATFNLRIWCGRVP